MAKPDGGLKDLRPFRPDARKAKERKAPPHVGSPLSPAFGFDLDPLIKVRGVPLSIHGHTHHTVDYVLGSTRVLTNQRGYPGQACPDFDPSLIVEI